MVRLTCSTFWWPRFTAGLSGPRKLMPMIQAPRTRLFLLPGLHPPGPPRVLPCLAHNMASFLCCLVGAGCYPLGAQVGLEVTDGWLQ